MVGIFGLLVGGPLPVVRVIRFTKAACAHGTLHTLLRPHSHRYRARVFVLFHADNRGARTLGTACKDGAGTINVLRVLGEFLRHCFEGFDGAFFQGQRFVELVVAIINEMGVNWFYSGHKPL